MSMWVSFKLIVDMYILGCIKNYVYIIFLLSNCNVSTAILESEIICYAWPTSEHYGCTADGDSWTSLDSSLDTSETSACEELCIGQGEDGCCYLGNGYGCYWKGGAGVSSDDGDTSISVKCISAGTLS